MGGNMVAPVTILLIEDDEVDREVFMRSAKRQRISNPIICARDGVEGLEILRGKGGDALARPCLIILDLNVPRLNGLEFLAEIRADATVKHSLVFVLTSSDDEKDISAAYDKNIAGYLLESRFGTEADHIIAMLGTYLQCVVFPPDLS